MPRTFVKFQHALKAGYFWARNGWGLLPHPKFGLDSPLLALVSLPFLCSLPIAPFSIHTNLPSISKCTFCLWIANKLVVPISNIFIL